MSVTIDCPLCKTHLRVPEQGTGRAVRCPRCATAIRLPSQQTNVVPSGTAPRPGMPPLPRRL